MSQTREDIGKDLQSFKNENPDWKTIEWKSNTVTGFHNLIASLSGFLSYFFPNRLYFLIADNNFI